MRRFFGKIALLALAAALSHGFVSCSDSGEEGNYTSSTGGGYRRRQ